VDSNKKQINGVRERRGDEEAALHLCKTRSEPVAPEKALTTKEDRDQGRETLSRVERFTMVTE
jgi:hypothetical protein